MRKIIDFNSDWNFIKEDVGFDAAMSVKGVEVNLPHTWNNIDGQDGGNDYYRGTCYYTKHFKAPELKEGEQLWLSFDGVAMSSQVCINGQKVCMHDGGYSTFRVDITSYLMEDNILIVSADNSKNDRVYPQKADFTFYGGIYRDVSLIVVPQNHFSLSYWGSSGVKITPKVSEDFRSSVVEIEAFVEGNADSVTVVFEDKKYVFPVTDGKANGYFTINDVHLWNGLEDPYMYSLKACLESGDELTLSFGCRTIAFDSKSGFFLNGKNIRLCGASRHQDRFAIGNALTKKEHDEDMALFLEMGANTIRLAHYQHSQYFYDLCDRFGLVCWVEIPYISEHLENGNENSITQMRELISQSYNHPSIICWGLSNEITASGGVTPDIVENHRMLNSICHEMDKTRPTAMAHAFMLDMDDNFTFLSDIRSFNLYYGWYMGELEDNDYWFDEFHKKHPDQVIGLAEYGADANPQYHNGNPERGDWSEEYQCVYHEHLLKMWKQRPYIWAMHCWNMFDFAADGRMEGGKPGQNQKGLVTFDRQLKKDAFYLYKAYLSRKPFVHICSKRYVERTESESEIKVYSNQDKVSLYMDGKLFCEMEGDKVFSFKTKLSGKHIFKAVSGEFEDSIEVVKVEKAKVEYSCADQEVINWFDKPEEMIKEGFYSIFNTMEEIKRDPLGAELLFSLMKKVRSSYGDVAKGVTLSVSAQRIMDRTPFNKILKQAGKAVSPEQIKVLNKQLNDIPFRVK